MEKIMAGFALESSRFVGGEYQGGYIRESSS
jgi:hypothetical protein